MKRKLGKIISIVLYSFVLAGIMTGCGTSKNQNTNQGGNGNLLEAKDSAVIAISSEPTSLDPCIGWGHGTTPLVQSTLVEYLQNMTFKNDLATDYDLSTDGLTWTFHIREDAYFTDGERVSASDVAFTFMTAKESQSSIDLTFMDKAEAVSDFTVKFTLNKPTSTFLNTIASTGIVPEHAYDKDYGTKPIGSGPYKFVQWKVGEQILLEANENYYEAVPAIKKVALVFMEEDAAFAAAKSGQVDVALISASLAANNEIIGYRIESISTLDNRGFTLPIEPNTGKLNASGYKIGNEVTSNLAIRQALAYGVDRNRIAKDAVYGYGDPAYSENDGMPWNNPEVKIETDVDYAKKLLSDDGWVDSNEDGILEKDGLKAEFTCIYPSGDSVRQAVALAAAEQAKELGIKIVVEGTSWDDISKRMFTDAVLMGWGATNPYTSYSLYHSDNKLRDDYYNPEGFDNKTVDGYLEKAMEAQTTKEAYENWQLAQWDGTTGTSMKGDCPWVWLVNIQHVYFVKDGLNIGEQQLHAHGASMTLIQNLKEWDWGK
jgi:peptide/nickel transport system substrate-binding protein